MFRFRRVSGGIIAALGAAAALAACGSSSGAGTNSTSTGAATTTGSSTTTAAKTSSITIAGVFQNTSDPFWTTVGCGALAEGKKLGVTVKNYSSTGLDAGQLSQNFTAALQSKPNGMFADLLTANQFSTQWKNLMTDGVPIVSSNPTKPAVQYKVVWSAPTKSNSPFIPTIVKLVPKAAGEIAVLGGVPGLPPVADRLDPLVAAIKKARPNLNALSEEYSGFDTNKAAQYVSSTIVSHPNLKVIVAADGPDAIGVINAVQAAHMAGKITVIALDAIPPEVSALKSGTITALLAQQPAADGAAQVKTLVDYIRSGKTGPVTASNDFVGVPQVLLTKQNVNNPAYQKYFYQTSCS